MVVDNGNKSKCGYIFITMVNQVMKKQTIARGILLIMAISVYSFMQYWYYKGMGWEGIKVEAIIAVVVLLFIWAVLNID
jgi:hypothetical protein